MRMECIIVFLADCNSPRCGGCTYWSCDHGCGEDRLEEKRKADFNMIRRKDKLDADVEFLGEFEEVAK